MNNMLSHKEEIIKLADDFKNKKKRLGLDFSERINQQETVSFMSEHLVLLTKEADLLAPLSFSKNAKGGLFGYYIKKCFHKISRLMIKFGFVHQQNFNDLTVVLAHSVMMLEERVTALEHQLKQKKD